MALTCRLSRACYHAGMFVLAALVLAIGPWTGPDVATAGAAPLRKQVALEGAPGHVVRLSTAGVPRRWVASWCTARVCAVGRTTVTLDRRGRADVELTIVPDDGAQAPWPTLRVRAVDGPERASRTFVARPA